MAVRGEVLVAILNDLLDFNIAHDRGWYRIPISSADKWLKDCWPPQWLAFYQTKIFGEKAYSVNYYAQVAGIRKVYRWELFPDQPRDEKSERRYYQLFLDGLNHLPAPIFSRRRRRIIFIPTTWEKFTHAPELNDLYDESPLEDLLWSQLKHLWIQAERQEFIRIKKRDYALDFAVYCAMGRLDIETDGDTWHSYLFSVESYLAILSRLEDQEPYVAVRLPDTYGDAWRFSHQRARCGSIWNQTLNKYWHSNPERAAQDNLRDNHLETAGWKLLRFNSRQIQEQMAEYCIPTVVETINKLGGVDEGGVVPRKIDLRGPDVSHQLGLFDNL